MTSAVYLPADEFSGVGVPDLDLAADYLELSAVLSASKQCFSEDIVDALELSAENEFHDVATEIKYREEIAAGAVSRMTSRQRVLEATYPFELDARGDVVFFRTESLCVGQAAYVVSLLLSNLRTLTPLLGDSEFHPSEAEIRSLRQYFQYFATAAIAAEIGGPAWSFGFPRPDGSGFIDKLTEIWAVLGDGRVAADPSSPTSPKDDQVDVFAWRQQLDGLPGFLLVAAQVATGKDWKNKPIQFHIDHVFPHRWFSPPPATKMIAYHVVPFARADEEFRDDVRVLGNVLHRLRVPRRVSEAESLVQKGLQIEAFNFVEEAADWVRDYVQQVNTA